MPGRRAASVRPKARGLDDTWSPAPLLTGPFILPPSPSILLSQHIYLSRFSLLPSPSSSIPVHNTNSLSISTNSRTTNPSSSSSFSSSPSLIVSWFKFLWVVLVEAFQQWTTSTINSSGGWTHPGFLLSINGLSFFSLRMERILSFDPDFDFGSSRSSLLFFQFSWFCWLLGVISVMKNRGGFGSWAHDLNLSVLVLLQNVIDFFFFWFVLFYSFSSVFSAAELWLTITLVRMLLSSRCFISRILMIFHFFLIPSSWAKYCCNHFLLLPIRLTVWTNMGFSWKLCKFSWIWT